MAAAPDAAATLSEHLAEVQRELSEYLASYSPDEGMEMRVPMIFDAVLTPADMARHLQLPAAGTEEGAEITVFSQGDLFYSEYDTLRFTVSARQGEHTYYSVQDEIDYVLMDGSTESVLLLQPPLPNFRVEYRNNTLRVYDETVPTAVGAVKAFRQIKLAHRRHAERVAKAKLAYDQLPEALQRDPRVAAALPGLLKYGDLHHTFREAPLTAAKRIVAVAFIEHEHVPGYFDEDVSSNAARAYEELPEFAQQDREVATAVAKIALYDAMDPTFRESPLTEAKRQLAVAFIKNDTPELYVVMPAEFQMDPAIAEAMIYENRYDLLRDDLKGDSTPLNVQLAKMAIDFDLGAYEELSPQLKANPDVAAHVAAKARDAATDGDYDDIPAELRTRRDRLAAELLRIHHNDSDPLTRHDDTMRGMDLPYPPVSGQPRSLQAEVVRQHPGVTDRLVDEYIQAPFVDLCV